MADARRALIRSLVLGALVLAALVVVSTARAHGTLSPVAAEAGSSQRFELTVPNDRLDADIVEVTLRLPSGMRLESAEAAQPRWAVSSSSDEVTWSGGPIERATAETFSFTARMPSEPGPLELVMLESYDDGDAAPFPIAVSVSSAASAGDGADNTLAAAAFVVAVLALVAATAALALALRDRRLPRG